ncbi:hypothetical protein FOMPIDRAFT_94257 [Fomitopsis schrenkii]|uniref:Uncharacterized protein n=1 Tax=Fomitopsis schrenkii TaxID=2126942 RepID=S8DGJ9_FOMSC|nr:hypothetical protein FOMPIDRAFT_94257 [Fomitopsis schrenkii]
MHSAISGHVVLLASQQRVNLLKTEECWQQTFSPTIRIHELQPTVDGETQTQPVPGFKWLIYQVVVLAPFAVLSFPFDVEGGQILVVDVVEPEPALLHVKQPWFTPFRRGCVTTDSNVHRVHAHSVVALGDRDTDGLFDLTNKVVGRALEGYTEEPILLAPFTRDITDCLVEDVGTAEAGLFREFVCTCLLTEFAVWWDMDLPTSVGMLRYKSLWDITRFFDTTFALTTFVGQAPQQLGGQLLCKYLPSLARLACQDHSRFRD